MPNPPGILNTKKRGFFGKIGKKLTKFKRKVADPLMWKKAGVLGLGVAQFGTDIAKSILPQMNKYYNLKAEGKQDLAIGGAQAAGAAAGGLLSFIPGVGTAMGAGAAKAAEGAGKLAGAIASAEDMKNAELANLGTQVASKIGNWATELAKNIDTSVLTVMIQNAVLSDYYTWNTLGEFTGTATLNDKAKGVTVKQKHPYVDYFHLNYGYVKGGGISSCKIYQGGIGWQDGCIQLHPKPRMLYMMLGDKEVVDIKLGETTDPKQPVGYFTFRHKGIKEERRVILVGAKILQLEKIVGVKGVKLTLDY